MQTIVKRHPRFWRTHGNGQSRCELSVDDSVSYNGRHSCLFRHESIDARSRGLMLQTMGAFDYRGKRLRFTAKLKTKGLQGKASLFMNILDSLPEIVLRDEMDGREISGDQDWSELGIVIDVPDEARYINFGAIIKGTGCLWIADLLIEEVGQDVAVTESGARGVVNSGPTNFKLLSSRKDAEEPDAWSFHSGPASAIDKFQRGLRQEDERPALWLSTNSELVPCDGEKSSLAGTYSQTFNCCQWRKQRVCFSADIKCRNVGDWCGLMMRVNGVNGKTLGFSTMYDLALSGDSDWRKWSVVLDVSPIACTIFVAATLHGNGEVFFSNLFFGTADASDVPTDRRSGPKNLNFVE